MTPVPPLKVRLLVFYFFPPSLLSLHHFPTLLTTGGLDMASFNLLKRRTIARFARKSGCNNLDEAKYYLETYHFDFDKALQEFREDAKVFPAPFAISLHQPPGELI
jgi:hypothetical protein